MTKIEFVLKFMIMCDFLLMYHLLGILIHNHLGLSVDLIQIVSFELQYQANNHNILSCKKETKHFKD